MIVLIAGLVIFFVAHSAAIVAPHWRERVRQRLGRGRWAALNSVVSTAGLVLIVWGYSLSWQDPVFVYLLPYEWRHVTLLLMIPVFPLLVAAVVPGHLRRLMKNPAATGIGLWAAAHLLANGTLGDILLFGSFLAWSLAALLVPGQTSVLKRPQQARLTYDALAAVAGVVIYVAFVLGVHQWLMGVAIV